MGGSSILGWFDRVVVDGRPGRFVRVLVISRVLVWEESSREVKTLDDSEEGITDSRTFLYKPSSWTTLVPKALVKKCRAVNRRQVRYGSSAEAGTDRYWYCDFD